jgi:sortase A
MRTIVAYMAMISGGGLIFFASVILVRAEIGQNKIPALSSLPYPVIQSLRIQPDAPIPSALIESPRLKKQLKVYAGFKSALYYGPEMIEGSALPGAAGNTIIAGHRDTHFRFLKDIRRGDVFHLVHAGQKHSYRVTALRIVHRTDTSVLRPTVEPTLTLVTCYPFYYIGSAPKRFIVSALLQGQPKN